LSAHLQLLLVIEISTQQVYEKQLRFWIEAGSVVLPISSSRISAARECKRNSVATVNFYGSEGTLSGHLLKSVLGRIRETLRRTVASATWRDLSVTAERIAKTVSSSSKVSHSRSLRWLARDTRCAAAIASKPS
jgi:hypothetical protein